jgi:gamma-glutamyltranspeptidase
MFAEGDSAAEAQTHPRWTIEQIDDPEAPVLVEADTSPEVVTGLRERGHEVVIVQGVQGGWGPVSVIRVGETIEAAADPRVGTASAEVL